MKTYARVLDGAVAELLRTDDAITTLFHPGLVWIDVSGQPAVTEGWRYDGTRFAPPTPLPPEPAQPSLAEIQAQVQALRAQVASLARHS